MRKTKQLKLTPRNTWKVWELPEHRITFMKNGIYTEVYLDSDRTFQVFCYAKKSKQSESPFNLYPSLRCLYFPSGVNSTAEVGDMTIRQFSKKRKRENYSLPIKI